VPNQPQQPLHEKKAEGDAVVSAPPKDTPIAPAGDLPVVSKEERVEYRDENGRILNEDEVAALADKVSFKTRYETRTRIVDAQGNEIYEGLVDAREAADEHGVAPPHPDAEGRNPETAEAPAAASEASELPPTVEAVEDQQKEQSIEQDDAGEAKPASDAHAATQEAE
jgi:dolichyl-phosphate-mannose-protein mannosyltransferase